jgi:drug/metabolite transporter superfamily protein YnfA
MRSSSFFRLWNKCPLPLRIVEKSAIALYGLSQLFSQHTSGVCTQRTASSSSSLSLLWGWALDGNQPDRFDIIGGGIALRYRGFSS